MSAAPRRKEGILNLEKYMDKPLHVKFNGGREVTGILKGFDPVVNLVLDETKEYVRDPEDMNRRKLIPDPNDPNKMIEETRYLGIVVVRGTSVMYLYPEQGTEEIENPFAENTEEQPQI